MGGGGKNGPTEEQRALTAAQQRQIDRQSKSLTDQRQTRNAQLRSTGGLVGRALLMNDEVGQPAPAKAPLARTLGGS